MIKTCLKFLLCMAIYAIVFIAASAAMPFSQGFSEFSALILEEHPAAMLPQFAFIAWICFAARFIIRRARCDGKKLFARLFPAIFLTVYFITFVGAMYSVDAFGGNMTRLDFALIMLNGLLALLITLPALIRLFRNKDAPADAAAANPERPKAGAGTVAARLGILGIAYLGAYLVFAVLVQWQFEEFRAFYYNTPWGQTVWGGNLSGLPVFISFQLIRGILNGLFILPLLSLIDKKKPFIVAACLVYVAPALNHLAPNPMMPDAVRLLHLVAMSGTMLLYGIIAGNVLWGKSKKQ